MFKNYHNQVNTAFSATALATFPFRSLPSAVVADNSGGSSLALEKIVVTARKKSESIRDVPLAITATTTQLQEGSVGRLRDIRRALYAPLF
jgi:outer membrane receptor protein involved in Fe transport